jgi:hypothetical protein
MAAEKKSETRKPNLIEVIKTDLGKSKGKEKKVRPDRAGLWGKIGFTLGIVSIGAWLVPLVGLPVAISGLVFNILGLRAEKGRWFAVAGLTLSIIFLNFAMIYSFYGMLVG